MIDKHKKISWTPIIVIGVILIFILIIIFGLGSDYSSTNPYSNGENYNSNNLEEINIDLVGSSQIKTINSPNKIVSIEIVGSSNQISITKETQISLIDIVGSNNIFNLCKNHSPQIDETGSGNVFNYINC